MKTKNWLWMVVAALLSIVTACNYTVGECYPRGDDDAAAVGVGPSGAGPSGSGGFGDMPGGGTGADACNKAAKKEDSDDGDSTSAGSGSPGVSCSPGMTMGSDGLIFEFCGSGCNDPACISFGTFSSAAFKFMVIVADDGKDDAGGWQEAQADLKFVRWTHLIPEFWTCHVNVGMAIRTKLDGAIAPSYAAAISAAVATQVSAEIKNENPDIPSGIFCSKLVPGMHARLKKFYPTLGSVVKQQ